MAGRVNLDGLEGLTDDERLMEAMEHVRRSGTCNMFDAECVIAQLMGRHSIVLDYYQYAKALEKFKDYKAGKR